MKLTGIKAMVGKAMAIGLVAGAVALVAPAKAQAQGFGIGVQIGNGYYDGGGRGYYEGERYERQREAWARHEAHEREEQREAWERQERHEQHERAERAEQYNRGGYGYAAPYGYNNGYAQRGYYGR